MGHARRRYGYASPFVNPNVGFIGPVQHFARLFRDACRGHFEGD
jgi:hypothetical protein